MSLSPLIIDFIEDVSELIDKNDFQEIYARLNFNNDPGFTSDITAIFLQAGIDPLDHLDFIPGDYAYAQFWLDKVYRVPKHIKIIGSDCFYSSQAMEECHIPDGCEAIYSRAFANSEDLLDIHIPYSVKTIGIHAIDPDTIIHCVENSVAHEYAIHNGNPFYFDYEY